MGWKVILVFIEVVTVVTGYLSEYMFLVLMGDKSSIIANGIIAKLVVIGVFGIACPMDVMGIEPTKRSVPVAALVVLAAIAVAFAARFS